MLEAESTSDIRLQEYHIAYATLAENKIGLKGKKVLEVGGSLPKNFVLNELEARQWIAVEQIDYWDELPNDIGCKDGTPPRDKIITKLTDVDDFGKLDSYEVLSGGIEELPVSAYEKFDVVFSIAAFEHIRAFPHALDKMFQALRKGGFLFARWSPLWSAHDGHHLPKIIDKSGRSMSFADSPIPPWGHLRMREYQLFKHLLGHTDPDSAARAVYYVYYSQHINRLFVEDYIDFLLKSKFETVEAEGYAFTPVPAEIQSELEYNYPGRKCFANNGLMVVLKRP